MGGAGWPPRAFRSSSGPIDEATRCAALQLVRRNLRAHSNAALSSLNREDGSGFELLLRLLDFDPRRRISAREALCHRWFDSLDRRCPAGGSRTRRLQDRTPGRRGTTEPGRRLVVVGPSITPRAPGERCAR